MRPKINATVSVVDMRNFTFIFEDFQKKGDDSFLDFMEEYYTLGARLARLAAFDDHIYFNTTGDGFLVIFYGDNHEFSGFLYGLLMFRGLEKIFSRLGRHTDAENASFGMGIETGYVQKVSSKKHDIETFLGSVVNIAARIETATKNYHRTNMIIGNELYTSLVKRFYPDSYRDLAKRGNKLQTDFDEAISFHNEMNKLSQKLMLFYLFEHTLKGVDAAMPLYRLSPTLASNQEKFMEVIQLLCLDNKKFELIKRDIGEYLDAV